MDPDAFSSNFFKWDPRPSTLTPPTNRFFEAAVAAAAAAAAAAAPPPMSAAAAGYCARPAQQLQQQQQAGMGGLEELFQSYGIRYYTAAKIAELGFTVRTLMDMKEDELDDMMNSLSQIFRWELLVGERYGIKAAVRAERRRLEEEDARRRGVHIMSADGHALDALSQEGLSEEPVVQQEKEAVGSGGGGTWEIAALPTHHHHHHHRHQMDTLHHDLRIKSKQVQQRQKKGVGRRDQRAAHHVMSNANNMDEGDEGENELDDMEDHEDDMDQQGHGGMGCSSMMTSERQREHPFIVTEPGEVARGKKNGLDYLFHLYELCRDFLIQVQNIAKERGEKCPTKVTNQVFRYAKKAGATYINKPKMRHYVHCYALHCLNEETSNALRRAFKERGENVGAWRQACYKPLVTLAARQGSWDIDAIFNAHPRLSIWYVPTKLRQLCHAERSAAAVAASSSSVPMVASMANHHLSNF